MKIEKINKAFEKTTYRILKHRWGILTFFAVILALSFAGVKKIVMKTSFDDYFLSDDPCSSRRMNSNPYSEMITT